MAPVFSKMRASDAQSTARQLSLAIPKRARTISELTDLSLLLIFSLLPLKHLRTQVPLACKRWDSLLPSALCQRRSLLLYLYPFEVHLSYAFLLHLRKPVTPPIHADYLNAIFGTARDDIIDDYSKPLIASFNRKDSFKLFHSFKRNASDNEFPYYLKLTAYFPNLTHLSLMGISLPYIALHHLLSTYQEVLQLLSLRDINFIEKEQEEETVEQLFPLIDSMTSLRALALGLDTPVSHPLALPALLPRLRLFTFTSEEEGNPLATLEALDGEKLTQLHLCQLKGWNLVRASLTSLFTSHKFASWGKALTRLTLTREYEHNGVTLPLFQAIVNRCTRLRHLDISTVREVSFESLLPHLVKLPRLTSLGLQSLNDDFFTHLPETVVSGARLTGLRRLRLEVILEPHTFTLLSSVCPNLRQLYLHKALLRIDGRFVSVDGDSDGAASEWAQLRPQLQSFAFLPKINEVEQAAVALPAVAEYPNLPKPSDP